MKEYTAQLSGPLTGDGLQGMMKRKNRHTFHTVLPFGAPYIDRNIELLEQCDSTQKNVLNTEVVDEVLLDPRGGT